MQTQQEIVMPKMACVPELEHIIMPSIRQARRLAEESDLEAHKEFRNHVFAEHIRTDKKVTDALIRANEVYEATTKTVEDAWALLAYYKKTISAFNKRMDDHRAELDEAEKRPAKLTVRRAPARRISSKYMKQVPFVNTNTVELDFKKASVDN